MGNTLRPPRPIPAVLRRYGAGRGGGGHVEDVGGYRWRVARRGEGAVLFEYAMRGSRLLFVPYAGLGRRATLFVTLFLIEEKRKE